MNDFQDRQEAENDLRDYVLDVNESAVAASLAVATRNDHMVRMVEAMGYSMYRVAQLTDMSQQMVARIVKESVTL